METIEKETYSLPLYDTPLQYWGLRSEYVTERDGIPDEDETRGEADESVTVTLSEGQYGANRIDVLHSRGDERLGTYAFEVVDEERHICSFSGSDPESVPWSVRRVLKRFGYHDRTTPETRRRYVFDHLISATRLLEAHADESDPFLRAWLYQVAAGVSAFTFFASFEHQLSEGAFDEVLEEFATNIDELLWWRDDVDESIFDHFYEIDAVDGPIYLPRADTHFYLPREDVPLWSDMSESVPSEAESAATDTSSEDRETDDQSVFVEVTNPADSRYVFGSLVSRYAIDRYRFARIGENRLVLEHDDVPDLPPYGILRYLESQGYTVDNVPTLHPKDSLPELLETIDELVRWIRKRYDPDHYQTLAAYSHYFNPLQGAVCLAALRAADERAYDDLRDRFFDELGISLESFPAKQVELSTLQKLVGEFVPLFEPDHFAAAERRLEEIQYEKRMRELEEVVAESDDVHWPDEEPSPDDFPISGTR